MNDIVSVETLFFHIRNLKQVYDKYNFLEYYSIVGAVPERWKNTYLRVWKVHDIINDIVDRLKRDRKKTCKYFYKLYLENINKCPFRSRDKWPRN
jgi:hypothetical protein